MAEKQKSKKQVAKEYFAALDKSVPLRDRIDKLVEFMKIEFVNGQTERVVFNYIRDDIPEEDLPAKNDEILIKIIQYKINQKSDHISPLSFDEQNPAGRVAAILMIVDLYAEKVVHHLGEWFYTNKISIKRANSKISFANYELIDRGWCSNYSSGEDLVRNHLPFYTKNQLESPISYDVLIDLSKNYLGADGVEIFNHLMTGGKSYRSALDYLENDYYWKLLPDSENEAGSTLIKDAKAETRKKPFILFRLAQWLVASFLGFLVLVALLSVPDISIPGAPVVLFWVMLASLAGMSIAQSPPLFFRIPFTAKVGVYAGSIVAFFMLGFFLAEMDAAYQKTPDGIAKSKSQAEATEAASSGTYNEENVDSYSGSSSSTRESLNYKTQERYENLSSEGKAYVDDQMKKADEFCARNPDFESCW